jgi:hypothetical protein
MRPTCLPVSIFTTVPHDHPDLHHDGAAYSGIFLKCQCSQSIKLEGDRDQPDNKLDSVTLSLANSLLIDSHHDFADVWPTLPTPLKSDFSPAFTYSHYFLRTTLN